MPGARETQSADSTLAEAIRRYADRPDGPARESLATLMVRYMRAHLVSYLRHRRFGFGRPIAEVATDVADEEVSILLPEDDSDRLVDAIRRLLPGLAEHAAGRSGLGAVSDEDLAAAAKQHLRLRAHQGAILAWKREHPDEARILRSLKSWIPRTPGIELLHHASGQLMITNRSELHRTPLDLDGLLALLAELSPPYPIRDVAETLARRMEPDGVSGGYCYLVELTRAMHLLRLEAMTQDAADAGAAPRDGEGRIGRGGIPCSIKLDRLTRRLSTWAEEILESDAAKRRRLRESRRAPSANPDRACLPGSDSDSRTDPSDDPSLHPTVIAIAIDRILEPVGLGRPEWQEIPLERLIEAETGILADAAARAARVHRVDYLIRRLRARMRSRWREIV